MTILTVSRAAFSDIPDRFALEVNQEILRQAEEMQADLIVIGSRGLKGMRGMLGSVSRRVLGRAHCSVLIGREANRGKQRKALPASVLSQRLGLYCQVVTKQALRQSPG